MKRRGAAVGMVLLGVCLLLLSRGRVVARPGAPVSPGRVIDRTRELFPQTAGWFKLVADARFDTDEAGRLVPDLSSLKHARIRHADNAGHSIRPRFAARYDQPMRIESTTSPSIYVDVFADRPAAVAPRVEDGVVVYADAYPDTDVLYKATPTHVDEYLLLRSTSSPTRYRFRVVMGPGLARLRQAGHSVEAVDDRGRAWLRVSAPIAVDRNKRRVEGKVLLEGDYLVSEVDASGLELPVLVDPDWKSTGDMAYGRFYHRVSLLPDGRVLATGGCSASICSGGLGIPQCPTSVTAAEALDLGTRTWSVVGLSSQPRYFHAAESLPGGAVLVAGGCQNGPCTKVTDVAEVVDPATGMFDKVAPIAEPRAGIASARLPGGKVLLAGGCSASGCTTAVDIFDPTTREFTKGASLPTARGRAEVATLADGRVVLFGGCTTITCQGVLDDVDIYDPKADSWSTAGKLSTPRGGHFASTLADGRVLIGGGCSEQACAQVLRSTELFDPATGAFSKGPDMGEPRVGPKAVTLPSGQVVVTQGCDAHESCGLSNELYDPTSNAFSPTRPAVTMRAFHDIVIHDSASLLVSVGGCQPKTCSWWNETVELSSLVPSDLDAGADAAATGGSSGAGGNGPSAQAGGGSAGKSASAPAAAAPTTIPIRPEGGGCDCSQSPSRGAAPPWLLALVGALLLRSRSRWAR